MRIPLGAAPNGDWVPLAATRQRGRPVAGHLLADRHTVWRVTRVKDIPFSDADHDVWVRADMPDPGTWEDRPYRVELEWVGGVRPDWLPDEHDPDRSPGVTIPAGAGPYWYVYAANRWPRCSCCDQPMPCTAEIADREVLAARARMTELESIPPGACWACREVITTRQNSVVYPGVNLDLPNGEPPRFHTRADCARKAKAYERRWLETDPRHERVLTWPSCAGNLVVHADRSSECVSWTGRSGERFPSAPGCQGHDTHDHISQTSCFSHWDEGCPRGCERAGHPGCDPAPRPPRQQNTELF